MNLQELIENIGEEGDFTSKMRESLVSIGRVVAFMQAIIDQMRDTKAMKENRARIKILQRDIVSLTDHASFLNGKISFLLDAVLGLISIEQNGIIKIFSVAAVVFLPPTLVASDLWHEFRRHAGTALDLWLSLRARPDGALGNPALPLFQAEGLAVTDGAAA